MGLTNLTDFINKWGIWLFAAMLIYCISCGLIYRWIHKAYSKGGIWENSEPAIDSLFATFFPALNTFFAIINIFNTPIKKVKQRREINLSKFFNIKK